MTMELSEVTDSDTVGRVKMRCHEFTARTSHWLHLHTCQSLTDSTYTHVNHSLTPPTHVNHSLTPPTHTSITHQTWNADTSFLPLHTASNVELWAAVGNEDMVGNWRGVQQFNAVITTSSAPFTNCTAENEKRCHQPSVVNKNMTQPTTNYKQMDKKERKVQ